MSRRNRHRAMEAISGPGANLSMGDKLALLLIGDLVMDGPDEYWESQGSLAERMGTSTRSAGRAVRSLTESGALTHKEWKRVGSGATVKVFDYTPEDLGYRVGETFRRDIGGNFLPRDDIASREVGRNVHPHRKFLTSTSEESGIQAGSNVLQTETEPEEEQIENPDKLAIQRSRNEEDRRAAV